MLRRVALVRTNVSERRISSIIRVTRIGELEATLAVSGNRSTLRRVRLLVPANVSISAILATLMMENDPPKRRFLQETHGVTSQKTPFSVVTAMKTSDITFIELSCVLL
jgi:hypothetical protein